MMFQKLINWKIFLITIDIIIVNLALLVSLLLRFEFRIPPEWWGIYAQSFILYTVIRIAVFYFFGLYKKLWQYASVDELINIAMAVSLSSLLIFMFAWWRDMLLPRSTYIIAWTLNILLIGGVRFTLRVMQDLVHRKAEGYFKKALIVGAGEAGVMVARELVRNRDSLFLLPVGFIDDDKKKKGGFIHNMPVLGNRQDISKIVKEKDIDEIIIAMPSAPRQEIRKIVEICKTTGVKLKILPGVYELIGEKVTLQKLREVNIEDLLGRDVVKVDLQGVTGYLKGETVLISGAGGSIGSELCRQVLRYYPGKLLLLGQGENSIYTIHRELKEKFPAAVLIPLIGSVQDRDRLEEIFSLYRPRVIFHAAAHKHLPLMEDNPGEAVKNNIIGTRTIAETAHRYKANHFVLVSTDKAVNPTSVMGATKRVAEMIIQSLARHSQTRFCAVRFGNVLGSRGSVVLLFREQIVAGGPVTVTHPEMVRYFMTIPEAVQLIIEAGAMGEKGEVFVLDMGEPVKIVNLAADLIRLSGYEPGKDIEIVYTGIRPGEKLSEEMFTDQEGITNTKHAKIFIAKANGMEELAEELSSLRNILQVEDDFLASCLPDVFVSQSQVAANLEVRGGK